MKEHQVSYDIFTPFGPRVLKSSVPQTVVDAINLRADEILNDDKKSEFEIKNKKTLVINNIEYGSVTGFDLKFNKDVISHSLFSLSHVKKSIRIIWGLTHDRYE